MPLGNDQASYQDAPTWSPDGQWVAYLAGRADDVALVKERVGAAGAGSLTVLETHIPAFLARPRWSPDGKFILCLTQDGLTAVAADASGRASLAARDGWRMSGQRMAV